MRPAILHSRAFTLIEMVLAIVLVGILAVSTAPAFRTLSASREAAAAQEIRSLLQTVRLTAMASGRPTGLACSQNSLITLVQIDEVGAAPSVLKSPLGEARPTLDIASQFGRVTLTQARTGLGDEGAVTFWFATDGTPHSRTQAGAAQPAWTSDGTITLSGGTVVTVRRVSGAIE
ncbi:MAG: prepilin-type N-terminal cleavage/methylation domain-containing protein [Tepidisphaera sp.]